MHILIFFILLGFVNSYDFDHSTTLTRFWWWLDIPCTSLCGLIVVDKDTNETMNFSPNTMYLSCQYTSNYSWNIICSNRSHTHCSINENLLIKYSDITLFATNNISIFEFAAFDGIIVINIPQNHIIKNNECLIVEFSQGMNDGQPLLEYLGKNNCNSIEYYVGGQSVPLTNSSKYIVRLGCYNDLYNPDSIANNDNYYFKFISIGPSNITYYIDGKNVTVFIDRNNVPVIMNKIERLIGIVCLTVSILVIVLYIYFRHKYYSVQQLQQI